MKFVELPLIQSDRLTIRIATKEDIPLILNYYTENKTYLTPYYPVWSEDFFTQGYWLDQVEIDVYEFINDLSLKFFIFSNINPTKIIGTANFRNFVRGSAHFCHLGYSLSETEQGKGYMTEALQAAIQYVFHTLNMHRIQANYMPFNQRSGNLLKRLGFIVEGYARDYLLINGKWQDHILTSLTNSHWRAD